MQLLRTSRLSVGFLFAAANIIDAAPTATINSGLIIGTTTTLPSATGNATVNKFLGIPFARPPLGDLRFALPEAVVPWNEPLNASYFKSACMQAPEDDLLVGQSEDCLYLNVFTPATLAPAEGRTVMIWIHGGGLISGRTGVLDVIISLCLWLIAGSAAIAKYDGSSFAANQVGPYSHFLKGRS